MNASIRSKVATATVALVASAGLLSGSAAGASSGSPDEPRAVEVQSDGTVIEYVVTPADLEWRGAAPAGTFAATTESGSVQVGTAGNTRYVATDREVIWGYAPSAAAAVDRIGTVTEIAADGGPVYLGMAGNIKYIVTSNEVIWGAIPPGTAL